MQWRRDGHTIDTDRARLPMETITRWLRTTYWASLRSPEAIRRSWENSAVVFGIYSDGDGEIIGWARVITDFVTTAYLADVFLVPERRGRGLGLWLVETILGHPDLASVGWLLHTKDAHELYRRAGFTGSDVSRLMQRPRPS